MCACTYCQFNVVVFADGNWKESNFMKWEGSLECLACVSKLGDDLNEVLQKNI